MKKLHEFTPSGREIKFYLRDAVSLAHPDLLIREILGAKARFFDKREHNEATIVVIHVDEAEDLTDEVIQRIRHEAGLDIEVVHDESLTSSEYLLDDQVAG